MAMDLVTVPEHEWFELDDLYGPEMDEKRHLIATAPGEVFAATPESDAARSEALEMILASLTSHHPDWFSLDGQLVRNHLTGETWNRTLLDPLDLAGRLVQEDLCIIQENIEGPVFTAATLCFPSRWRLGDKIGKRLAEVHGPVPLYANRLARPVDRIMHYLKPNYIVSRLNWSLLDDPALFQPGGKWRTAPDLEITADNAGARVYLRVERQTLRRMPVTSAVLFGIRVHVYPVARVIDRPERAAALAASVQELPPEIRHYKSLPPFEGALMDWLRAQIPASA